MGAAELVCERWLPLPGLQGSLPSAPAGLARMREELDVEAESHGWDWACRCGSLAVPIGGREWR